MRPHFWLRESPAAQSRVSATGEEIPSPFIASHKMANDVAHRVVSNHTSWVPRSSLHNCVTAVMCSDSCCWHDSSRSERSLWEGESTAPSRYWTTTEWSSCGWTYCAPQRKARGRCKSFCLNSRDSAVFLRPPGVCRWSPAHTLRHVRGVRPMTEVSSCWLSSVRVRATSLIHVATGL